MNTDEWKIVQNRLVDAWEHLTHTLQQVADVFAKMLERLRKKNQEKTKPSPYFNHSDRNKKYYLCNEKTAYKIKRKPKRNLPYQRRDY